MWYVYGIVPATFSPASLPSGLDDVPVLIERTDGVGALVSVLDGEAYAPAELETNSGDVEWLSPRAIAHDRGERVDGGVLLLDRAVVRKRLYGRHTGAISSLAGSSSTASSAAAISSMRRSWAITPGILFSSISIFTALSE